MRILLYDTNVWTARCSIVVTFLSQTLNRLIYKPIFKSKIEIADHNIFFEIVFKSKVRFIFLILAHEQNT